MILSKSRFFPKLARKINMFYFSSSQNSFNIKLDLYSSEDTVKRFYVPSKASLFTVENLIKSGDSSIKTVDFSIESGEGIDKSNQFIDSIMKKHMKLTLNSTPVAYRIDAFHDLGYCLNSKYDEVFKQNEIPFPQASLFSSLFHAYDLRFAKENANNINSKQVQENFIEILKNFSEINQIKMKEIQSNLEISYKEYEKENMNLQKIEQLLSNEAKKTLKFWLGITTTQFVVLFYICYYVYGWDFTEPIGYLISLA